MAYNYEYPYTDPYRYNDDWLLRKMKDLIDEWAAMQKQFADLQTAFNDLKNYVMNYFANLNVQQEVENVLNQWLNDGTIGMLFTKYALKFKGPLWTSNVGAIVVGGTYSQSIGPDGQKLSRAICSYMNMFPIADLAHSGDSMMINGDASYFNRISEWKSNNPDYRDKGYSVIFIFPDRSDISYSQQQYANNVRQIINLFPDCIVINLPYMLPNYDAVQNDLDYAHYFNNIADTGSFILNFNSLTRPSESASNYYSGNHDILTEVGVLAYLKRMVNQFIFYTQPLVSGIINNTLPSQGYLNFRCINSFSNFFVVVFNYKLSPSLSFTLECPLVYGEGNYILPLPSGRYGHISISNGNMVISTGSDIVNPETGRTTIIIPYATIY